MSLPFWLGWGLFLAVSAAHGTLGTLSLALLAGVVLGALCFLPLGLLYAAEGLAWCADRCLTCLAWGADRLPSWAIWPVCLTICGLLIAVAAWHS